jgi:hypothetical protein
MKLKMTIKLLLISLIIIFSGFSCVSSPIQGIFFSYTSHHIYDKGNGSQLSSAKVTKMGQSCSWSSFFIREIFYGSGIKVDEAMKEANITKVAVIDHQSLSILGSMYYQECVQVFGE